MKQIQRRKRPTTTRDSRDLTIPELIELDQVRLDRDWTWEHLAGEMSDAGLPLCARTLHALLKRKAGMSTPIDRTLHKIRRFLKLIREADAAAASSRRARSSASVSA
jgi:hypothetical protein